MDRESCCWSKRGAEVDEVIITLILAIAPNARPSPRTRSGHCVLHDSRGMRRNVRLNQPDCSAARRWEMVAGLPSWRDSHGQFVNRAVFYRTRSSVDSAAMCPCTPCFRGEKFLAWVDWLLSFEEAARELTRPSLACAHDTTLSTCFPAFCGLAMT